MTGAAAPSVGVELGGRDGTPSLPVSHLLRREPLQSLLLMTVKPVENPRPKQGLPVSEK